MKFLVSVACSCAVVFAAAVPSWAQAMNDGLEGGKQTNGKITNLTDTEMTVETASGTQVYKVDPGTVKALNLTQGSEIILDGSSFVTGRISRFDPYFVEVELDDGEVMQFVLSREARRTLWVGDRVVITSPRVPSRCQKIFKLANYTLMARDIRLQPVKPVAVEMPAPAAVKPMTTPAPVPARVEEPAPLPIRGLW